MKLLFQIIVILFIVSGEQFFCQKNYCAGEIKSTNNKLTGKEIVNDISDISEFSPLDKELNRFIQKWEIVGATVAVMKNDKLVFAKGYGYSDKEAKEKVQPYHIFRLGSVSKLITAVAVMKLVEEGKLKLNDRVFGKNGILNEAPYLKYADKRVEEITVEHLLRHQGGWNRKYGDHMFMSLYIAEQLKVKPPASLENIIQFALTKRLHFVPGSISAYSNLGYCILDKVIEKVTNVNTEDYIVKNILEPLGIYDMKVGGTFENERVPNEVKYYEPPDAEKIPACDGTGEYVQRCYGGTDYKTLAAAGGWISSSIGLAKLVAVVDGFPEVKDILSEESIEKMSYAESTVSPMGWRKTSKKGDWWRTGTLAATAALVKRQNNGICYVVITNTGSWKGPRFYHQIEQTMDRALEKIKQWPENDLFSYNQK